MNIRNSVAFVTGANRGIGRAFVETLLEGGARRVYAAQAAERAFIPALEAHRGAVINMLTLVALVSMPALSAYNASKAAALSLTQSLRADLAKRGVTVHGVFPGAVDTDMIREFEMPKTPAHDIARAVLAAVEPGQEDIFPDAMAQQVYTAWRQDPKAVERQIAAM